MILLCEEMLASPDDLAALRLRWDPFKAVSLRASVHN